MDPKEIFQAEYDRLFNEAIDDGYSEDGAHLFAEAHAYDAMRDRYADAADELRQRAKDARL